MEDVLIVGKWWGIRFEPTHPNSCLSPVSSGLGIRRHPDADTGSQPCGGAPANLWSFYSVL